LEPSGENATLLTAESTVNVDTHVPVDASQILTVLSSLTLARDLPSVLHDTALTHLKAFKSVRMHKNNCFEKSREFFEKLTLNARSSAVTQWVHRFLWTKDEHCCQDNLHPTPAFCPYDRSTPSAPDRCARSTSTRTYQSTSPISSRCCQGFH